MTPEPLYDPEQVRPVTVLRAALARIDGWGPLAWKEIVGAWQLPGAVLAIERPEWPISGDEDERTLTLVIAHGLGRAQPVATADWVLRQTWAGLLAHPEIRAWTLRPGAAVRATNACYFQADGDGALVLRLHALLPYAGMCLDARRFRRFLKRLERFVGEFTARIRRPGLAAHRRAVAVQQALRAALPAHGLIAFLGESSVLPRNATGGPAPQARPLVVAEQLAVTVDLGRLGVHLGLGIKRGVTALAGAPYHGKSTVLQAIAAGAWDHPPGDGRELVVADPALLFVQAEDGRRIKDTDLSAFFAQLPGAEATAFATPRASGATSMAASVLQGLAAGVRLLLIDEDSAASNLLVIDAGMRRLLGHRLAGTTTLLELLPALAAVGVSSVLVAGSATASLGCADTVLILDHFQPQDATAKARKITPRAVPGKRITLPRRRLADAPDALFGPRHFLRIDATEPERPRITVGAEVWLLDLRRSGWDLDAPLVTGAILAAAWCCRLAEGDCDLAELALRSATFTATGAVALDPFHTALVAVPPWQLVVGVLERLERPWIQSLVKGAP